MNERPWEFQDHIAEELMEEAEELEMDDLEDDVIDDDIELPEELL